MNVTSIGLYRSSWLSGRDLIVGPDEDEITLAVAAARAALADTAILVQRVVLICSDPEIVLGADLAVLRIALRLPAGTALEQRIGGAPATLDAIAHSATGTLVIAVDLAAAAAGAALTSSAGTPLVARGTVHRSLPMRVRRTGEPKPITYPDPRVERELAVTPASQELRAGATFLVGVTSKEAARLSDGTLTPAGVGAASAIFAVADIVTAGQPARLIGLDAGTAVAVDVAPQPDTTINSEQRSALPTPQLQTPAERAPEIPLSMPAYFRAIEARAGLVAAECVCGEVSYPARRHCLNCGRHDETHDHPLPDKGEVYTVVTVHTDVPGIPGPYALAIVSLDGEPVRMLCKVTDANPASCRIGDRGRLVLRRVAIREGVADYAYAFQPDEPIKSEVLT
jgi:uncharacterized OB-fold protein